MISSTAARCCSTSASRKLAQKPFGPSGQFSGSARKNRNTASPRNINGQIFAQEKYLLWESSASSPIRKTIRPAQLWLYSDQAMSPGGPGGGSRPDSPHDEIVRRAEKQQAAEQNHFGSHHDAVRRAVERVPRAHEHQAHAQPGQEKYRDADLRQPGKSLADSHPNALIGNALHRKQQIGKPANPARGRQIMQRRQSNEYGAAFHSRERMAGDDGRGENEHRRNKHGAIDAFLQTRGPESNGERSNDRHNSCNREVCAEHFANGDFRGIAEDQ